MEFTFCSKTLASVVTLGLPDNGLPMVAALRSAADAASHLLDQITRQLLSEGFGLAQLHFNADPGTAYKDAQRMGLTMDELAQLLKSKIPAPLPQSHLPNPRACLLGIGESAASALVAATNMPAAIGAMVVIGGRLSGVLNLAQMNTVPTLFIVGAKDTIGGPAATAAFAAARGPKELSRIAEAGHLLREPGAFEVATKQTVNWYKRFAV